MAGASITRRQRRRLSMVSAGLGVVIVMLAGSCGGDGPTEPPQSLTGDLEISLSGASTPASAVLIAVSGPSVGVLSALNPNLVFLSVEVGSERRAVFIGDVQDGQLARFPVPDTAKWAEYRVDLIEMAGGDYRLASPSAVVLSVAPAR